MKDQTCKMCGGKPKTYKFRYFAGEQKGEIVEVCVHEYNQMLTDDEPLALMEGQTIQTPAWFPGRR